MWIFLSLVFTHVDGFKILQYYISFLFFFFGCWKLHVSLNSQMNISIPYGYADKNSTNFCLLMFYIDDARGIFLHFAWMIYNSDPYFVLTNIHFFLINPDIRPMKI